MAKSLTTAPKLVNKNNPKIAHKVGNSDAQDKAAAKKKAAKAKAGKAGKSMTTAPTGPVYEADPNMSSNQNAIQYGIESGDMGLNQAANSYVDDIQGMGNFAFNGPAAPQYNPEERQRIESELMSRFERYDAPQRQQENEDLTRWAQSTGNSVDSPAYAARQKQLADSQNARALDARSQAVSQGLGEAQGQFEMSQNAHQTAYGEQLDQWGRPLQTFGAIRSQISPSWSQGQQNSQQLGQIAAQGDQTRKSQTQAFKLTHSGGGGSGGRGRTGGGMTTAPQGYTPTYMGGQQAGGQASQPSYYSQLGNTLLPKLAGPLAEQFGSGLVNKLSSLWS